MNHSINSGLPFNIMANELCSQPTDDELHSGLYAWDHFFPIGSSVLFEQWRNPFPLVSFSSYSAHREFELSVRTEEFCPLSWAAKPRWAARSLKMCFACLVTLKAISCHSYSVHWQRKMAPWQIVLATGPYMHCTLKLASGPSVSVCEWSAFWSKIYSNLECPNDWFKSRQANCS